jgi:probable selenate reductase FAD-binding subunit
VSPSYHRPTTIEQALQLKSDLGTGAVFLAGGTEVNNGLAARPVALIDLAGLGLGGLEFAAEGVRIGAGVTFQQLVDHPSIPWYLKRAATQMANRNIRNRATVGGHLGLNRSCADLIPTLLVAQAQVYLTDREVPIEEYLAGEPELILSVFVPTTDRGFGLDNMTRTASDISLIATAASLGIADGCVQAPMLAVGGVAAHVVRLHDVERRLDGKALPPSARVEELIAQAVLPIDDQRGSAAYKRELAAVLGARALRAAVEQTSVVEGGQ